LCRQNSTEARLVVSEMWRIMKDARTWLCVLVLI